MILAPDGVCSVNCVRPEVLPGLPGGWHLKSTGATLFRREPGLTEAALGTRKVGGEIAAMA